MSTDRARGVLLDALTFVAPDVDVEGLDPAEPLREQADLDSMDFMELVAQLAEAVQGDIPVDDYPRLETIDAAVAYLAARLG
ncbi:MAG: acyl carrier protein [Candidatus Nanopelagicales bacterium]|nr:acyl carrier protein [Candidatus Nanopelagicales bacterium]